MSAVQAKHLKSQLRALLLCSVTEPAVIQNVDKRIPTITSPLDTNTLQQFIRVNPIELILYDLTNGRIRAKVRDWWRTEAASTFDLDPRPFRIKFLFNGGEVALRIDGGEWKTVGIGGRGVVYARDRIDVKTSKEDEMTKFFKCVVNGSPLDPLWIVTRDSFRAFKSATFSVTAP